MPISNKLMTGLAYHNIRSGELEDTQQILRLQKNINWIITLNWVVYMLYLNLDANKYDLGNSDQSKLIFSIKL